MYKIFYGKNKENGCKFSKEIKLSNELIIANQIISQGTKIYGIP